MSLGLGLVADDIFAAATAITPSPSPSPSPLSSHSSSQHISSLNVLANAVVGDLNAKIETVRNTDRLIVAVGISLSLGAMVLVWVVKMILCRCLRRNPSKRMHRITNGASSSCAPAPSGPRVDHAIEDHQDEEAEVDSVDEEDAQPTQPLSEDEMAVALPTRGQVLQRECCAKIAEHMGEYDTGASAMVDKTMKNKKQVVARTVTIVDQTRDFDPEI